MPHETAMTLSSTLHKHRTFRGYQRDGVLDFQYVAVFHSKETNLVSEKARDQQDKRLLKIKQTCLRNRSEHKQRDDSGCSVSYKWRFFMTSQWSAMFSLHLWVSVCVCVLHIFLSNKPHSNEQRFHHFHTARDTVDAPFLWCLDSWRYCV